MILFNVLFAGDDRRSASSTTPPGSSLSERSRELASLRVLGFTRGEISSILLGELAVWYAGGDAGRAAARATGSPASSCAAFNTELYRFPLVSTPRTFAYARLGGAGGRDALRAGGRAGGWTTWTCGGAEDKGVMSHDCVRFAR